MHRGRASAGTDARINGTVVVRVKHVIDRGRGSAQSARHLVPVLVLEGSPTQDYYKQLGEQPQREGEREEGGRKIIVQDVQS